MPNADVEITPGPALYVLDDFELMLLGTPEITVGIQRLVKCKHVAIVAVVQAAGVNSM